jgi:carboxypeptidase C (cathepsin A)
MMRKALPRAILVMGCLAGLGCTMGRKIEHSRHAKPQAFYSAAAASDEVKALPGWAGLLPTKVFSGMLPIAKDMYSHYMYVEREPSSDATGPAPLLLWSNGGPGASSMFGLFTEIGPMLFSGETLPSGVPELVANPHSWTKVADVLIFDAPPPIGFSFCDPSGPAGPGTSCGDWDDARTTHANLQALKAFFLRFPALMKRDLFLSVRFTSPSILSLYSPRLFACSCLSTLF